MHIDGVMALSYIILVIFRDNGNLQIFPPDKATHHYPGSQVRGGPRLDSLIYMKQLAGHGD